jgi:hemoglobin-like flavoprotein
MDYDEGVSASPTDVFLASLKRCLATPGFLAAFYDRFLGASDEVREKFRGVDMKQQARVLEDSLYVVANAVQGREGSPARGDLPRLAERHSRRGLDIRPGLYDVWAQCLVETAREHDPQWADDVAASWRETLAFGVEHMRRTY